MTTGGEVVLLTRPEALAALDDGKRIRFRSWWWKRFIYLDPASGKIVDEAGKFFGEDGLSEPTGYEEYYEERHGLTV